MAFTTTNLVPDVARGSEAEAAAQLANATAALAASMALGSAGIAIGTTTTKIKTATTVAYTVNGKVFSKAGTDDFWTLSGAVVPASSWAKYALLIDASAAASIQASRASGVSAAAVDWRNVSAISPWAPLLSILGGTKAILGVITVATDATHTFTPGTTALGATGITTTYVNGIDPSLLPLIGTGASLVVGNGG